MSATGIRAAAEERGVTRLCHITRSMALPFILEMGEIVATSRLSEDERAIFYPNDEARLDGHTTHVSCSVQYPNAWYLRAIQSREPLFRDWIVLLLDPDPLWWDGTLFCPANAATQGGALIGEGLAAFNAMYDAFPPTHRVSRGLTHLASCATDNQAEVLVPDGIPAELIRCMVVPDQSQAKRERWRLDTMGTRPMGLMIAIDADFFDPRILAGRIASGVETNPTCEPI